AGGAVRGIRPGGPAVGRLEHGVAVAGDVAGGPEHLDVVEVAVGAEEHGRPRQATVGGAAELALAVADERLGGAHGGDALGALGRAGVAVGPRQAGVGGDGGVAVAAGHPHDGVVGPIDVAEVAGAGGD